MAECGHNDQELLANGHVRCKECGHVFPFEDEADAKLPNPSDELLEALSALMDNDESGSVRARLWDFVEENS